jgi:hypothetical protein
VTGLIFDGRMADHRTFEATQSDLEIGEDEKGRCSVERIRFVQPEDCINLSVDWSY